MTNLLNPVDQVRFDHVRLKLDKDAGLLWLYMNPAGRPCFSTELIKDIRDSHRILLKHNGHYPIDGSLHRIFYHVMTSEKDRPYNLGGDLKFFLDCIQKDNRQGLRDYAKLCIEGLYPTVNDFDFNVTTIALVRGQALGGGFESVLSNSIIVAERSAKMGLPEVLFNLFPGMGAYHLLARRLPIAQVEKMILSGKLYDAEELFQMGVVDVIAEDGFGEIAVHEFIKKHQKKWNTQIAIQRIRQNYNPISFRQLMEVCEIWVDAIFNLSDKDLKTMRRLVRSQVRLIDQDNTAEIISLEAS